MWRRFFVQVVAVFAVGSAALFALLALADPWGTLPFRSPLPRAPADHSQRWAYPELARDGRFDAAIIGDSTARLIDPADLDGPTGARFANLAMVHSYPFEQMALLDVFLRAHPAPRAVLIGLDRPWCEREEQPHYGYEPLPAWLYEGGAAAALRNLLNIHGLETAWRSASAVLGWSPRPYGDNGFQHIDVDRHPFDPALARKLIDQDLQLGWSAPAEPDPASWPFPALDWLGARLARLPASTRVLLVFTPHHHRYPAPGSAGAAMVAECKARVVALARRRPNTGAFDLSMPGPATTTESFWWDAVHMRPEPMAGVSRALGAAIAGTPSADAQVLVALSGR